MNQITSGEYFTEMIKRLFIERISLKSLFLCLDFLTKERDTTIIYRIMWSIMLYNKEGFG